MSNRIRQQVAAQLKTSSKAVPGLSDEKFMEAAVVLKMIVQAMLAQLGASEGKRKGAK